MPDDVRLFGADTHVPKKTFPWLLGGAAVVAFLALRSKPAGGQGPSLAQGISDAAVQSDSASLEFYKAQQEAAFELSQLTASNKLEAQAQSNAYAQTGAGQRMCIPLATWYRLGAADRTQFTQRVNNGQLIESIGPDGICFTPTSAGISGYMPYTKVTQKQGLFGGSYSVTGPANAGASYAPTGSIQPTIFDFLESILRAFNQPFNVPGF